MDEEKEDKNENTTEVIKNSDSTRFMCLHDDRSREPTNLKHENTGSFHYAVWFFRHLFANKKREIEDKGVLPTVRT